MNDNRIVKIPIWAFGVLALAFPVIGLTPSVENPSLRDVEKIDLRRSTQNCQIPARYGCGFVDLSRILLHLVLSHFDSLLVDLIEKMNNWLVTFPCHRLHPFDSLADRIQYFTIPMFL